MRTIARAAWLAVALAGGAYADDPPAPTGNFLSSLKQSFRHDYDHEVIRGHFDIGTPPNAHRYYCLVDPKTGKLEENGIAGTPTPRRDGMTAIEGASVSFYNCADAEAKGLLVTSDYHVTIEPGHEVIHPAPRAAQAPAAPSPAGAGAAPTATATGSAAVAATRAPALSTNDPMSTLESFISVYNSGDGAALPSLLGESANFAWVQSDGRIAWGQLGALDVLRSSRAAGSQMQMQSQDGPTIAVASKTAILITKLRVSQTGQDAHIVRCSGVLVQTGKGWRIASLFMSPAVE